MTSDIQNGEGISQLDARALKSVLSCRQKLELCFALRRYLYDQTAGEGVRGEEKMGE